MATTDEIIRRQGRHEDDGARRLVRLLRAARRDIRVRLQAVDAESATAAVLRQMEAAVTQALAETLRRMLGTFAEDVRTAWGLGLELADVALPQAALNVLPFRLSDPLLEQLGQFHAGLIQEVTDTLRGQITRQVQLALLSGQSTPELVRSIGASGLRPTGPFRTAEERAEAIARTELNRVPNLATARRLEDAGERLPGLLKEWLTAGDARVRESHRRLHGVRVPVGGTFDVGGTRARHPLDPVLPAGESVRCRCRLVAVLPEE